MNFRLHFDKPVAEIEKELAPGSVMGLVMVWLADNDLPPVATFWSFTDEGQSYADLKLPVEIDDWKLESFWDKLTDEADLESVSRLPDYEGT